MKNTKKILAVLLAGTMVLGVLSGCGSTAPAATTETPAAEDGGGRKERRDSKAGSYGVRREVGLSVR